MHININAWLANNGLLFDKRNCETVVQYIRLFPIESNMFASFSLLHKPIRVELQVSGWMSLIFPENKIRLLCLTIGIVTLLLNSFCLFLIIIHRRTFERNIFRLTASLQVKFAIQQRKCVFPRYFTSYSTCTLTLRSYPWSMPNMEADFALAGFAHHTLSRSGYFS